MSFRSTTAVRRIGAVAARSTGLRTRVLRSLGGRRPPVQLVVLLVVAAAGSLAWSFAAAPLQGPDEEAHVAYVQRIVETGELPQDVDPRAYGYSSELTAAQYWGQLFQVPLNPFIKPDATPAERAAFEAAVAARPGGRADGRGFTNASNNPPLYYLYESVPYAVGYGGDFFTRLQLMRLAGMPLLLVVVTMTWLLAAELLPRPYWGRVLAAGVVAVHPVAGFISGVVNPDNLLAAIGATFLYIAVRTARYGASARRSVALGALCAASALTQPRGVGLVVPAALALGFGFQRRGVSLRSALRWGGAVAGLAAVGIGLYVGIVRSGQSTSGQLERVFTGDFNLRQFLSYLWQFYLPKLDILATLPGGVRGWRYVYVESFFAVFGQLDVFMPHWVYEYLYKAALYGLSALAVCLMIRSDALRRCWRELAVLVATFAATLLVQHLGAYSSLLSNNWSDPVLVGRYLLPLIPLYGLAVGFVAASLPRRFGQYVGATVLVFAVLLQLAALGTTVARYHA